MEPSQILEEVLQDEQLACGAVIDEFGEVLSRAGDFGSYPAQGLVSSALGPSGTPKETYTSLEGQPLPQIWADGEYFAFIDRPTPGLAFVLFGAPAPPRRSFLRPLSGEREAFSLVERSRRVGRKLREAVTR